MAIIENAATRPEALDAWKKAMQSMDRSELIAQQLVQRGAEDALVNLQRLGVTPENCQAMLTSLREGLIAIHEVAHQRGIQLFDYSGPAPTEQGGQHGSR